jgi:hypothetical protein
MMMDFLSMAILPGFYWRSIRRGRATTATLVMPALVAGIHVLPNGCAKDVDGRDKPGHDSKRIVARMKRSEIRERAVSHAPDCASLHPGYACCTGSDRSWSPQHLPHRQVVDLAWRHQSSRSKLYSKSYSWGTCPLPYYKAFEPTDYLDDRFTGRGVGGFQNFGSSLDRSIFQIIRRHSPAFHLL